MIQTFQVFVFIYFISIAKTARGPAVLKRLHVASGTGMAVMVF